MNDSREQVRKLTIEEVAQWSGVGAGEIYVGDVIDQATTPSAEMTVGFARIGKGEALDISFPYDEVLIVTKGVYVLDTQAGRQLVARAGDVVYLPAGTSSASRADEDTEMVYVACPPSVYADHVAASGADQL